MVVSTQPVVNFGHNVRFTPKRLYTPNTERELLDILREHKNGQIRVVASRHSWSEAIVSDDVLIDMRHFNSVRIHNQAGEPLATVGGGCQIKSLLGALNKENLTTPSLGLITEQTLAGAISTATHGSGKHSLSHYVSSMRITCYTPDGESATIREVTGGTDLQAARCGLGCLGVIVDVTLRCVPQYFIREKSTPCDSIEDVLARQENAPLQQFFLIPHLWRYYAQERAVAEQNEPSRSALFYRWYWFLCLDVGLHLAIKLFAAVLRSKRLVRFLYRCLLPAMIFPRWIVTDRSDRMLVMEHEMFRHLEMEVFVPAKQIVAAAGFVNEVLQIADGSNTPPSSAIQEKLRSIGMLEALESIRGTYCHHFPVCFRRVFADDTLISMSAGTEDCWHAISFITYVEPREPFYNLARFLAASMAKLFQARPHWGKWFPFAGDEICGMYPGLHEFREVCERFDPRGVFRNRYVTSVLGLPASKRVAEALEQAVS
jgi:hypothetical protein